MKKRIVDDGSGHLTADFKVVEHTADWSIRARGRDLRHLLHSAAYGMSTLLVEDLESISLDVERAVAVEGFDRESILVEWLGELAYLAEQEGLVFREYELQSATPQEVRATIRGGRAPELLKHIKAVTYHNLEVKETSRGLEATIVFDV